jgi:signal transduction histidine kinase
VTADAGGNDGSLTTVEETLSALPDAYLLTDLDGRVTFANRATRQLFSPADPPRALRELVADSEDHRQVLERWRGSAAPRPGMLAFPQGHRLRGDGCRLRTHSALVIRLTTPDTAEAGLAELTTQVHARNLQRRQEELDQSLQRLHAANRRLDAFEDELREHAGAVAHDVRTPLFTILGAARRLQRGNHLDADGAPYLALLLDASEHLHDVTESLLDIARIDHGVWNEQKLATPEVLAEVLETLAERLDAADAEVIVGDLPGVVADHDALFHVLRELLDNSICYRAEDRPLHIEVSGRRQDRWVEIGVTDNGRGVPPGPVDRLFELFQGGTRAATAQGRGIGLATCRRLVTRWGGQIRCERPSTPGARFVFTARSHSHVDRTPV